MEPQLVINAAHNVKIVVYHPIIAQLAKVIGELVLVLYQFHFVLVKIQNLMMELVFSVKVNFYK